MSFELNNQTRYFFNEISAVPRKSGSEMAVSQYIADFAEKRNLNYIQDALYNVVIYKNASSGYENRPAVILQAHMDMVCEKVKGCEHDFDKDPLDLYEEDGWLKAGGTTLGADDGVGVAYMLAVLDDENLPHPRLECVFTVQEEIGLIGALNLDKSYLHAGRLINLDGNGEYATCVSSAGGVEGRLHKTITWENNDLPTYILGIEGLSGGHSGDEIHKEKGNAVIILVRIMEELIQKGTDIRLATLNGGTKDNAIPREAEAKFVSSESEEVLNKLIFDSFAAVREELTYSDPDVSFSLQCAEKVEKKMSSACSQDILDCIYLMPNGVMNRSMAIEGLTLTSLNLGITQTGENEIYLVSMIRSSLESGLDHMAGILSRLSFRFGFTFETCSRYPAWPYRENSYLREVYRNEVKKMLGRDLDEFAAHYGLECSIFNQIDREMDIITLGPSAVGEHTPQERLNLESFDRCYQLLTAILREAA